MFINKAYSHYPRLRYARQRKRASRKIHKMYAIFARSTPTPNATKIQKEDILLAYVPTEQEAIDTLERIIYLSCYDHFVLWLSVHYPGKDKDTSMDTPMWKEYADTTLEDEDIQSQYKVVQTILSLDDIASILRMSNYVPLWGMPYEDESEIKAFLLRKGVSKYKDMTDTDKRVFQTSCGEFKRKAANVFAKNRK